MFQRLGYQLVGAASVITLLASSSVSSAFAHAQYTSSTPAANATLSAAPTVVGVTFSEELSSIQIVVTGPHGSDVTTAKASIDLAHRTLANVPLKDDGSGVYTVVWRNVSGDDGDPNDGSFIFTVAGTPPVAAVSSPALAASTTPSTPGMVASPASACADSDPPTRGINDVRVNTYCKRQAIRDQYRGWIDENTFNFELASGIGFEHALADAMKAAATGR